MKKITLLLAILCASALFAQDEYTPTGQIKAELTSVSLEKYGPPQENRTFKAKQTVFINLKVTGLMANAENKLVIQADLKIPQLSLDRKNLIDGSIDAEPAISMYFRIPIGSVQRGGRCNATITIRDVVAKKYIVFNTWFLLEK